MSALSISLLCIASSLSAFVLGIAAGRSLTFNEIAQIKSEAKDLRFWERESLTVSPEDITRSGGA